MAQTMTSNVIEREITEIDSNKKSVKPLIKIVWGNVIYMTVLHMSSLYGLYLCFVSAQWKTIAFGESISCMVFYFTIFIINCIIFIAINVICFQVEPIQKLFAQH